MSSDSETISTQSDEYKSIAGSRSVETVKAKTRLAFVRDDLFPNMPLVGWKEAIEGVGEKIEKFLGMVAAPSNTNGSEIKGKKKISISLPHYGRADFIPMVFTSIDGTIFSGLYRRGVGGTRKKWEGDFNSDNLHRDKPESAGLAFGENAVAESQMAYALHKEGVRIRLPVFGLYIDEVQTVEGIKNMNNLVELGVLDKDLLEKKPMMVFFARRNPYTFADAVDYIKEGGNPTDLLKSQAQYLRRENNDEANKVADLIENDSPEAMKTWFGWMAKTFGQQISLWARIGFIHPAFHGQNMTLAIETGDTGDLVAKFKLKPILLSEDEATKVDFADQGFSALYFLNSLLKDVEEVGIEKTVVENFVDGMFKNKDESTEILVNQMLKMLKVNSGEKEYLTECLRKKMSA